MQQNRLFLKWISVLGLISLVVLFYYFGGNEIITFTNVQKNLLKIQSLYSTRPLLVLTLFSATYLFLTMLAIPGSLVLTILSGAIFGTFFGIALVSICGTVGATISFLMSRYLMRDFVNSKFHHQFVVINKNLKKDDVLYLFLLRFFPLSPFGLINLILGLTRLHFWTFIWTTFMGMIPGNIIYVFAGQEISRFHSPADIMSPSFLVSLFVLALLPLVAKKILKLERKKMIDI